MQQPIVVREVHTEHVHDTIRSRDSIYIDRWHTIRVQGDTVYITDSTSRVEHHTTDRTTDIAHGDSIPYPVEVPVEVPTPIPRFYIVCTRLFFVFVVVVVVFFALRNLRLPLLSRARRRI